MDESVNEPDTYLDNEAHERDLAWLNAQVTDLEQSNVKIMILSHWSLSLDTRAGPRQGMLEVRSRALTLRSCPGSVASKPIKSDFERLATPISTAMFPAERESGAGPLRVLSNQRGYYFAEAEGFDGEKAVGILSAKEKARYRTATRYAECMEPGISGVREIGTRNSQRRGVQTRLTEPVRYRVYWSLRWIIRSWT